MSAADFVLLQAVRTRLSTDATLSGLTGGIARVHDGPPRNAPMPYLVVDPIESRDIGGLEAPLAEHRLTITVWSKAGGKREALAIADRVDTLVDDATLTLPGFRLVQIRLERRDARIARDKTSATATLTFRAVTEPV